MPTSPAQHHEPALNTEQAAAFLGLQPNTIVWWRWRGDGPCFYKVGRRVVYRPEDLRRWLAERRRTSTSDAGPASAPNEASEDAGASPRAPQRRRRPAGRPARR